MTYFSITSRVAILLCLLFSSTHAAAQEDVLLQEEQAFKNAVARVAPSVARIETIGGLERVGDNLVGTGPTTGLVVSEDGLIVSSAFNFVQKPTSILVTVEGEKTRLPATILARDASRQLVLLKIEPKGKLTVPEYVPRSELVVGQWTIAIGKTFQADAVSMSAGVLSATHRIWGKAVQTDAKVSPANYGGPLIDIQGRVIGVLVPMSPRGASSELAGSEWYDSGIGFAAPLADVMKRLDDWRESGELKSGILGIGLKGKDVYSKPAEVASVRIKSPAAELGIESGDKIVEVNGDPVTRQAQLKHALGPLYAGDPVSIVVERDGERVELGEAKLVGELEPYDTPFLGILPLREAESCTVRHIFPGSPAEQKLQVGDWIKQVNGVETATVAEVRNALSGAESGDEVTLTVDRGGEELAVKLTAASLPEKVADVPPELAPADAPAVEVGEIEIKLPEAKNQCFAYIPESVRAESPTGLLTWVHAPGKFDREAMIMQWKPMADERGFILLIPRSLDEKRWTALEAEFIHDVIQEVQKTYVIDEQRLVVGGEGAGGAMAWLVSRQHADLVRGVAPIGAPVPRGGSAPEADPQNRTAYYVTLTDKPRQDAAIRKVVEALRKAKLPVTFESEYEDFGDAQRGEIAQWLDQLDRL